MPLLSKIAKSILVIQSSNAPSERLFSKICSILDNKRTNISNDNVSAILFLHNNNKGPHKGFMP